MKIENMREVCIIGYYPFETGLDFFSLLGFTFGSFCVITFLLFYYDRIPKSKIDQSKLTNPIFQTTDIFLQSNSAETSFSIAESKTSTWVIVLAFVLILCVAFTPFQEFLGL